MHHAAILAWVKAYGYPALSGILAAGVIGVPVPDETLLLFAGYLVFAGVWSLPLTLLAAFVGSAAGITISYGMGRYLGLPLLRRYGHYVHATPERVDRLHRWFQRRGHWLLTFGYFVPGGRHLTALIAGSSALEYRTFALFAYSGAALWVATFVLAGYWLGREWHKLSHAMQHEVLWVLGGAAAAAVLAWAGWKLWRRCRSR